MRKSIVKSIFKKEIIDILRDKKTLFMTIILPILLYPTLVLLLSYIMNASSQSMAKRDLMIATSTNLEQSLADRINERDEDEGKLTIISLQDEDYEEALNNGDITAYIKVDTKEKVIEYEVYYNASSEDGMEACSRLEGILEDYKKEKVLEGITALGLDEKEILEPITYETHNVAKSEQLAGYLLGVILPFILVISILTGAIYPAIDVMAGEKERGTLETLLTMPISNMELVMGKYLAVSLSALVSALLSVLSIVFSVICLCLTASELVDVSKMSMDFSKLILPFLLTFICIGLFTLVISAVSMCVCSLARSFKEAQNAMTPLMLVAMVLSYASMIPTLELSSVTAGIPVVNVVLAIKSVLTFKFDISLLMLVLVSNIIFVLFAVWILSKLFKSEDILFGNSKSFSFLEKRSDIKKGTLPGFSDGIILFAVSMVALIYICGYLQAKFEIWGVALTEVIIFAIPVLLSIYIKTDFKKVYSLNKPKLSGLLGSGILWLGMWLLTLVIEVVFQQCGLLSENQNIEFQTDLMMNHSTIITFFIIAVMPAICEETLFRGFIYTALKEEKHDIRAIILSGILFSLMHIEPVKLLPIVILGIGMGYILYKTGSIFCTILVHLLNNGIAVILTQHQSVLANNIEAQIMTVQGKVATLVLAVILSIIGILVLKISSKEKVAKNIMEG